MIRWVLTRTLAITTDRERAATSLLVWGDDARGGYRLRVLGVVKALMPHGVSLVVWEHDDAEADETARA